MSHLPAADTRSVIVVSARAGSLRIRRSWRGPRCVDQPEHPCLTGGAHASSRCWSGRAIRVPAAAYIRIADQAPAGVPGEFVTG